MYQENNDFQITFLAQDGQRKTEVVKNTSIIAACQRIIQLYSNGIGTIKIINATII
jgi:hypothetical protein